MTGIVNHADVLRVGHSEHTVDFVGLLHGSRHVMMVHDLHAAVISDLAEVIQTLGEHFPFVIVQHLLVCQRRVPLMLDGEGLIRGVDDGSADGFQEIHMIDKGALILPHRQLVQVGADPAGDGGNTAAAQLFVQDRGVTRELAADLGASITGQSDFTDRLQEAVFSTHLRHIVLGPCNRRDTDFNLFGI